jgi:DNA-binding beta-propeller fold protein YncE
LTLSHDGNTLYAANAALGTIASINLDLGLNTYQLWLIGNAKVAHFQTDNRTVTTADETRELHNGAALSRDQNLLYVVGLHGIWVIKTHTFQVQDEYLKQQDFTGLGMSGDGSTLYGVDPATGITLLDSNSGDMRAVINGASPSPWGIEWSRG